MKCSIELVNVHEKRAAKSRKFPMMAWLCCVSNFYIHVTSCIGRKAIILQVPQVPSIV